MPRRKTTEDTRAAALNAMTHGILANPVTLRNENPRAYDTQLAEYVAEHQPATPTERDLVEEMHVAKWRQRRVWAVEAALLDHTMDAAAVQVADSYANLDEPTRTALAMLDLTAKSNILSLLSRYDVRFSRMYHRALQSLLELKSRRPDAGLSAPELAENTEPAPRPQVAIMKLPNEPLAHWRNPSRHEQRPPDCTEKWGHGNVKFIRA